MPFQTIFSPAKLNLFLAITGRRPDGFHDLVSVVSQLEFGDTLSVDTRGPGEGPRFVLTCSDVTVPCDETNLVLRAAQAFATASSWEGMATFRLEKRIPMGAGLGGGSSNAAATLRALNALTGNRLDQHALAAVAASIGSDCPLFLHDQPVIMRGRGERIEPLPALAAERLHGRRVVVFKPAFAVPTAWAYRRMAEEAAGSAGGDVYLPSHAAEERLSLWINDPTATMEALLYNNMERAAFGKFLALPVLLEMLRRDFGLSPRMSGSGSACFAFLPNDAPIHEIAAAIRTAWGDSAFVVETRLA